MATRAIESSLIKMRNEKYDSILDSKTWKRIIQSLEFIISYHKYTSSCTSIVIEIQKDKTKIRYIPRNLEDSLKSLLKN